MKQIEILAHSTLFSSSFIYNGTLYNTQISTLFTEELISIIDFLNNHNENFSINKKCELFEPIFVNINLIPQPHGSSRRVIVVIENERLYDECIRRVKEYFPKIECSTCKSSQLNQMNNFHYLFINENKELV